MSLKPGDRLGPYEIAARIGVGGMGEVYRARDTRLNRDVAVKVLPDAFAGDPERLLRLDREAQMLAALNHPHVAHVHGLEPTGAGRAVIMEFVAGPTLEERLSGGALSIDETILIATQIAEALEAAHEQGIIHRDLKPANIKVRDDGTVKVLDFGLAKAVADTSSPNVTQSPTMSLHATVAGVILGTAAYMAPEQARGKPADRRADIWAFGAIVFEMLTGSRPFDGDTISDVLARVIEREPDWSLLPAVVPARLRSLIQRCLRKEPKNRLQSIGDARIELQELNDNPPITNVAAAPTRPSPVARWLAIALGVAAAAEAIALSGFLTRSSPAPTTYRFDVAAPQGWRVSHNQGSAGATVPLAISPNGRRIAFVARDTGGKDQIWIRELDALDSRPVPGTEGAIAPFWSADSRFIGFAADGKLKRVETVGGPPIAVCDVGPFRGGTWNSDNVIVFATSIGGLRRVAAGGGTPTPATATQSGEIYHTRPMFLPDGRHFIYRVMPSGETFVAGLDSAERTLILSGTDSTNIAYSLGHLLFLREATLMAQPFDARALKTTGDPFPIAEQVQTQNPPGTGNQVGVFSASVNGVLILQSSSGFVPPRLEWFDRTGRSLGAAGEPAIYQSLSLSHDGKRAAVHLTDAGQRNRDIWVIDLERGGSRLRLTFDPVDDIAPIWSADDTRIVFSSRSERYGQLLGKAANGAGGAETIVSSAVDKLPWSMSRDGKWLLYQVTSPGTGTDLWRVPLAGERKPVPFLATPFSETLAQLSPDARWVAYTSNESGQPQIFVTSFPEARGKWMVSTDGGRAPRWRADGRELYFLDRNDNLTSTTVNGVGESFDYGRPQPLFKSALREVGPMFFYDVAPGGERFLMVVSTDDTQPNRPITVVVNWNGEGRR